MWMEVGPAGTVLGMTLVLLAVAGGRGAAGQQCPGAAMGTPPAGHAPVVGLERYDELVAGLEVEAVLEDVVGLLTSSQECWPADESSTSTIGRSYGGLFIRLAWHCAGTFRTSDGRGGCAGGRQRFAPEASWEDNTNLDKARALLWPIKEKYGDALSWGDLFVLAGTGAILHMGGPVTEVCVGRVDEADGKASLPLGPGDEQPPCPMQGNCQPPLGTSTVGLIYVNPEGFMGIPNPKLSAVQIRDVFGRMGMNDTETVALIGGGHAFGFTHGACPLGAGPSPAEQPGDPWPGRCGTGKGKDTFTSGFNGSWTTDPFKWDNEFFQLLDGFGPNYTLTKGSGGKHQWFAPQRPDLTMLTADLALVHDEAYKRIVHEYATDLHKLEVAFAAAWEKLVVRGGTWSASKKCWRATDRFRHPGLPTAAPVPPTPTPTPTPPTPPAPTPAGGKDDDDANWGYIAAGFVVGLVVAAIAATAVWYVCCRKPVVPSEPHN